MSLVTQPLTLIPLTLRIPQRTLLRGLQPVENKRTIGLNYTKNGGKEGGNIIELAPTAISTRLGCTMCVIYSDSLETLNLALDVHYICCEAGLHYLTHVILRVSCPKQESRTASKPP